MHNAESDLRHLHHSLYHHVAISVLPAAANIYNCTFVHGASAERRARPSMLPLLPPRPCTTSANPAKQTSSRSQDLQCVVSCTLPFFFLFPFFLKKKKSRRKRRKPGTPCPGSSGYGVRQDGPKPKKRNLDVRVQCGMNVESCSVQYYHVFRCPIVRHHTWTR